MNKQEIITELEQIANRLEDITEECRLFTGYVDNAAILASFAINHTIDLMSQSELINEGKTNDNG